MIDRADDWRSAILDFWFGLDPERWWESDPQLDETVRARFFDLWTDKRQLPADSFLGDPRTALAATILFDQFPRNMFRGHADSYSTDPLAEAITRAAVDLDFDQLIDRDRRLFLYMPLMHSENLDDQNRSLMLFTKLGNDRQLDFAKHHHDIIERYERFPHRNLVLGRESRPDEIASGADRPW